MTSGGEGRAVADPPVASGRAALRVVLIYAAFAAAWIISSDVAARYMAHSQEDMLAVSVLKGMAFVAVTALLLYGLIRRILRKLDVGYHALRERDAEIHRLSSLYAALSEINQASLWSKSREALLADVSRALTEHGGLRLAWVGHKARAASAWSPGDAPAAGDPAEVDPMAVPDDASYCQIAVDEAIARSRPAIRNELASREPNDPCCRALRARGFAAFAVFPIRDGSEMSDVLVVGADREGFFREPEVELLTRATTNVSYALDNLRREERRVAAESLAHLEREFSQVMLEQMPGVMFVYDADRRIARWNRQLEAVSGYSAAEIGRMRVPDFFPTEGRQRVEQTIDLILAGETSNTVGRLQSRDGRITRLQLVSTRVEIDGRLYVIGHGVEVVPDAPAA